MTSRKEGINVSGEIERGSRGLRVGQFLLLLMFSFLSKLPKDKLRAV